jgi:agmatine/peptidylarginine deiminase
LKSSYSYPPEWVQQSGTILIFPKEDSDWGCCFRDVEEKFLSFIKAIAKYQKVYLISDREFHIDNVEVISGVETDDTWARDSLGLTIFKDKKRYLLNYQFNGWGGKFDATFDNQITKNLAEHGFFDKSRVIELPYIVEGGAIETNGDTLLVTESSTLNSNRNQESSESRSEIEKSFKEYLGVERVIWLKESYLKGDDTDGHIDMLARFANRETILYSLDSVGNELKERLPEMRFVQLPSPSFGDFPATYLNFIFVNGAILVPVYGLDSDKEAIQIFRDTFPDRDIVEVDSSIFIQQGGSLHCLTMQLYDR